MNSLKCYSAKVRDKKTGKITKHTFECYKLENVIKTLKKHNLEIISYRPI